MSIETLGDWNVRLEWCGCCPMPVCPQPVMICEGIELSISLSGGFQDPDYPPEGAFALAQWETNRRKITELSCTLDVNEDTTDGSGGGFHEIGSGSLVVTATSEYDEVWDKGGCDIFTNTVTESYSGDGSFDLSFSAEIFCGGAWTKKLFSESSWVYTYVGGDPNPSPPPDFYPAGFWRLDYEFTEYSYACDGGVLSLVDTVVTPIESFWNYPSVVTTSASGTHPARVITSTDTYEGVVTWDDFEAEMLAWITENKEAGCWETSTCAATRSHLPPTTYITTGVPEISTRPLRFRFRIPSTHLGSKFWITYDIGEFPEDGDPSFFSEDNLIEWTGPGTGDEEDESWLTDWIEIDPPEVSGQRRVVNIRYTCYSGEKYGRKPQVMGEALEIEEP